MDLYLNKFQLPVTNNQPMTKGELASLVYHDIFDYPLTLSELLKWEGSPRLTINNRELTVNNKNGFYFLAGHEGIIYKRLLRKRVSERKMEIARKAGRILSFIPTIKMVGVTGALAMENAIEESDIDLIIITKKKALWTSRFLAYFLLLIAGIKARKPRDKDQKDKICLNMWLSEDHLTWRRRNVYTAHEIAQIVPLVNKEKTYEKFIWKNRWIKKYWPNSVRIKKQESGVRSKPTIHNSLFIIQLIEFIAFQLQYQYMKSKITHEKVSKTRAIFHPNDWGKVVLSRLNWRF